MVSGRLANSGDGEAGGPSRFQEVSSVLFHAEVEVQSGKRRLSCVNVIRYARIKEQRSWSISEICITSGSTLVITALVRGVCFIQ